MAEPRKPALVNRPPASAMPFWVRAIGYDPNENDRQSYTFEMHSMAESETDSGLSDDIGMPSEIASVILRGTDFSFAGRTNDANILSLEASSDEDEDDDDDDYDDGEMDDDLDDSFEDRAFAKNSTPLYEALRRREWRQAMVFLQNGSFMSRSLADGSLLKEPRIVPPEEQVRTWVSLYETDGRLVWRRLPIHDALCRGAPVDLIHVMLQLHPLSVTLKDIDGNLPLHLALKYNAERMSVELILQEYPQAMEVRNDKGKLPLECVTIKGKESELRGEVLQRYVSSAKQVATQKVPKLKDKLFEVNKTIEAAKSELRLAKVELGMIKQQEKMRQQNKEREECRMKEEVLRLRSELELLRGERQEMSEERQEWAEKAKKQEAVVVVSDSDDSDDSQRGWIANEFTEMVSELEKTTRQRKLRGSSGFTGGPTLRSSFLKKAPSSFPQKQVPSTSIRDYDLKESKTDATETSFDLAEQQSEDISGSKISSSSNDSEGIPSIREEFELRRRVLRSHSGGQGGAEQPHMRRNKNGSSSGSEEERESFDKREHLAERIKKLQSHSSSSEERGENKLEDRIRKLESRSNSEELEERIRKLESGSNSEDSGERLGQMEDNKPRSSATKTTHPPHVQPSGRLSVLDNALGGVLGQNDDHEGNGSTHFSSKGSVCSSRSRRSGGSIHSTRSGGRQKKRAGFSDRQQDCDIQQASSKVSVASSIKSGRSSTKSSKLEMGLALVAQKSSSSEAKWNSSSMADDLTVQDDNEDDSSTNETKPMGTKNRPLRRGTDDGEAALEDCREEEPAEETREDNKAARVTFAEETVIYEDDVRNSFSPQFRRFDDQVDKAMTRISRKTYKLGASTSGRSRNRSSRRRRRRSRNRARTQQDDSEEGSRNIYVTNDNMVEILSSEVGSVGSSRGSVGSSRSAMSYNTIAVSKARPTLSILSELGYASDD